MSDARSAPVDAEPTPEQRASSSALSRAIVAELRKLIAREAEGAQAAGLDEAAETASSEVDVFLQIEDGRTGIVTKRCPLAATDETETTLNVSSWNAITGVATGRRAHLYRDDGTEIPVPDALIPTHDSRADLRVGRRRSR